MKGARRSGRRRRRRWFPRLRLRHKLAISLSVAALLPVVVASWVAVSVVLRGLNVGLRQETQRQVQVGLNLILRNVERLGQVAVRLSESPKLLSAMGRGKPALDEALVSESPHLPSSLVQVADNTGAIVAQRVVGGVARRFRHLAVHDNGPLIRAGLAYERRVTIVPVGGVLVVRAVAPVVDESYLLEGVVVVSVPLDASFADSVKGALGTDVLIFAVAGEGTSQSSAAASTFVDRFGARVSGLTVSPAVAEQVARGHTVFTNESILGTEYALGYAPLHNLAGDPVGVFAVAVDRAPLRRARSAATRSLALGAAGAFVFALGLAGLLSRRITGPIARLHRGALAIARGDLDHRIEVTEGDEIGDLARAFSHMTTALKENQQRLAARMREIVALHDAGRAVSSVIDLDQVLHKIVDSVARVLNVRVCALWLVEDRGEAQALTLGAARAKRADVRVTSHGEDAERMATPLTSIAAEVAETHTTIRVDSVAEDPAWREAAVAAGVTGSLIATPVERKHAVVGVIIIGRLRDANPFSQADADLLATFGDQAATAIENARLYEEVRAFNEELEQKVKLRTTELTAMNAELGRALKELQETQSQLILSERLAGLGQLVAGVAHEINSPSAAIRGSVDSMTETVQSMAERSHQLARLELAPEEQEQLWRLAGEIVPELIGRRIPSPTAARRNARELAGRLEEAGLSREAAAGAGTALVDLGFESAGALFGRLAALVAVPASQGERDERAKVLIGFLTQYVYLHRSAHTIQNAIRRIQRIVGALKSYSHLDQEASLVEADIHEGIENTLVILDHLLGRGINVTRNYAALPRVPVYVDELNQVWTNLIHNAVQALQGQGNITIETEARDGGVAVRVIDDGPGIGEEVMPRIFESFYTTKPKGEGTGLGLGIVRQIVDKHGGRVTAASQPGCTRFEVWLPGGRAAAGSDPGDGDEHQESGDRSGSR